MKKHSRLSLFVMALFTTFITPALADIDSFFDITYSVSPADRGGSPTLSATLSDGSDVPIDIVRMVRFQDEGKNTNLRIVADQDLGRVETVLISARCSPARCDISEVEQKRYEFRGHVTVLK